MEVPGPTIGWLRDKESWGVLEGPIFDIARDFNYVTIIKRTEGEDALSLFL